MIFFFYTQIFACRSMNFLLPYFIYKFLYCSISILIWYISQIDYDKNIISTWIWSNFKRNLVMSPARADSAACWAFTGLLDVLSPGTRGGENCCEGTGSRAHNNPDLHASLSLSRSGSCWFGLLEEWSESSEESDDISSSRMPPKIDNILNEKLDFVFALQPLYELLADTGTVSCKLFQPSPPTLLFVSSSSSSSTTN